MKQMAAFMEGGAFDATGPLLLLTGHRVAAVQLSQNGHSFVAQHFEGGDDRSADKVDVR
ncbi:MAG: hypothetical protein GXP05_16480 [Alphaproteobacteria bacterium]|nr:hypothetical protein [Alphaproteobacteria bacterium]